MARKFWIVPALAALIVSGCAGKQPALRDQNDKLSYGIGVQMARTFEGQGVQANKELIVRGLADALSGKPLLISEADVRASMQWLQADIRRHQAVNAVAGSQERRSAGATFLEENAKKEGVVTRPSGLQYKVLRSGDGRKPTDADVVVCHYRGSTIDGAELDNTYSTGQPATLPVKGLLPGWREAIQLMPVGSKWQLFLPPQLAYGSRGSGRKIPPNTTLVIELELLSIK